MACFKWAASLLLLCLGVEQVLGLAYPAPCGRDDEGVNEALSALHMAAPECFEVCESACEAFAHVFEVHMAAPGIARKDTKKEAMCTEGAKAAFGCVTRTTICAGMLGMAADLGLPHNRRAWVLFCKPATATDAAEAPRVGAHIAVLMAIAAAAAHA